MPKDTPFKLVNQELDKNPVFDNTFPDSAASLSPICRPLYWQMVHTACDQDVIDSFFRSLVSPDTEAFEYLSSLITENGEFTKLTTYMLSTYRLIEPDALESVDDYVAWFTDALNILMGHTTSSGATVSNPVWDTVLQRAPYMSRVLAILGLFDKEFAPDSINTIIMSQLPSARLYSTSGLSEKMPEMEKMQAEKMQERAREKIFGLRVDYLLKLAKLCENVFIDGTHEPDPNTLSTIISDINDKYAGEPVMPDWMPDIDAVKTTHEDPSNAPLTHDNRPSSKWRQIRTKGNELDSQVPETITQPRSKESDTTDTVPPVPKVEPKVEPKPVVPPAPKVEPKPAALPAPKVEPKPVVPPAPKVEPKPAALPAPKVEPKPAALPAPKVEPKPAALPAPKVEPKPTVPPAPKVEPKPAVPPAPKVEPKPVVPTGDVVVSEEPAPAAPAAPAATPAPAAPAAGGDSDLGDIVIGEPEPEAIPPEEPAADEDSSNLGDDMDEGALPPGTPASSTRRINVPQRVLMEIFNHAGSNEQITDAVHLVEQDIENNTPNAQFLVRFVPGVTQEIIKDILVNRTSSGRYINRSSGKSGDAIPHTNLTGGTTYTAPTRTRSLGPVEVPPGFAQENSSVLWDEPVITTMGYPFINFGAPEIYTILKDKDETRVKKAYKKLKTQLKKVGLTSPIKVLKDFKNAKGVPCTLNRITVDSADLLEDGNANIIASVYPRASLSIQSSIGTVPLTRDFIVEMYKVLSPTKGARIYMDMLGMTEDEYADTLNREGRPPIYIFIPKEKLGFRKAPAGFITRLFTSNNKPTLVEARIGTHSGGFVMPFKASQLLFTEM